MQTGNKSQNQGGKTQGNLASRGMTVVELLIIVAALAVVILLAVHGSSMLIENYRLKSASSYLLEGLNLPRGEALRQAAARSGSARARTEDSAAPMVTGRRDGSSIPTAMATAWSRTSNSSERSRAPM